jgi:DNA repair exonuclease SbcCD ATPase subunit
MKITKFIVENFGPHERVVWTTDGGVIGVTGENGSGKTHLLLALEFGIRGELPGNRATYVRTGAKDGFVELHFEHNGRKTRLKRWVKSSKREMDWDDPDPLTKQADVDRALTQMLDTPLSSFGNASFIRQGELKDVLDGTETQKRNVMIKLESLGFVSKRGDELGRFIKKFTEQYLDESVYGRRDQLQEEIKELDQAHTNMVTQMGGMKIYSSDIRAFELYFRGRDQVTNLQQLLEVQRTKLCGFGVPDVERYKTNQTALDKLRKVIAAGQKSLSEKSELLSGLSELKMSEDRIQELTKEVRATQDRRKEVLEEIQQERPGFEPTGLDDFLDLVSRTIKAVQLTERIASMEKELTGLKEKAEAASKESNAADEVRRRLELELNSADLVHKQVTKTVQSIKDARDAKDGECTGDKMTCPKCSLKVIPVEMLTDEFLNSWEAQLDLAESQWLSARERHREADYTFSNVYDAASKAWDSYRDVENNLDSVRTSLAALDVEKTPSKDALAEMQRQAETLRKLCAELGALNTRTTTVATDVYRLNEKIKKLKEDFKTSKTVENLTKERDVLKVEVDSNQYKASSLEAEQLRLKPNHDGYQESLQAIKMIEEEQLPAARARVTEFEPSENVQALIVEMNTEDYDVIYSRMQEVQRDYDEVNSKAKLLVEQKAEKARAWTTIEQRIAKQEEHKRVLDRLNQLKEMLSPEGVIKTYLKYRLRALVNPVTNTLNLLNSNFVIRPSKDSLSYEFMRIGQTDDKWLDINKLSGGQKVKLGIAFLIAVQQTICKDVNFLVLDEPSTHLDESSVTALGDMLKDLSSRMERGDGQFWVVDHHTNLSGVFSHNFRLGSSKDGDSENEPDNDSSQ